MPHQPATPSEADAPRPWAREILHARIPAALKLLLLALFAALAGAATARHLQRRPRKDWLLSITANTSEDLDSDWDPYVLRRLFRLRARLGWLMRCDRAEGMALSGHRAPVLRPPQAARAPPAPPHARNHPESVAKTPHLAEMSHARSMARQTCLSEQERKKFFFEKKNQKTFISLSGAHPHQTNDVFLLLFLQKKKTLPYFQRARRQAQSPPVRTQRPATKRVLSGRRTRCRPWCQT